jgi:hypothetical protein
VAVASEQLANRSSLVAVIIVVIVIFGILVIQGALSTFCVIFLVLCYRW